MDLVIIALIGIGASALYLLVESLYKSHKELKETIARQQKEVDELFEWCHIPKDEDKKS